MKHGKNKQKLEESMSHLTVKEAPGWDWGDVKTEPLELLEARSREGWARAQAILEKPMTPEEIEIQKAKELKEKLDEDLKYWPWNRLPPQLFTRAPFKLNSSKGNPFRRPELPQMSHLLAFLLANEDVCELILHKVFENYYSMCSFAASSRFTWWLTGEYIGKWDATSGFFGKCDTNPEELEGAGHGKAKVPAVLVISPVRGHYDKRLPIYDIQVRNIYKLSQAVGNYSDSFRHLQLHRIPFLTTEVLMLLVPKMRNLTHLGVFACSMINISHTVELLDIIKTDKPKEKENQITLDFFPAHHVGPILIPGSENYSGNYGVTWDNWGGDTRLAIWALMTKILPKAVMQGVDLMGKHTMFRKWLEMSPCTEIDTTLKAIMDPTMQPEKFAAVMDWANYQGNVEKLINFVANRPEEHQWMITYYRCGSCHQKMQGVFFFYDTIRTARNENILHARPSILHCLGCKLSHYLRSERDHFKHPKREIMRRWIYDGIEANTYDLPKLLSDYDEKEVHFYAMRLNEIRYQSTVRLGYDKEFEDRQRPPSREEKGRLGIKYLSPTYEWKINFERYCKMTPEEKEWAGIDMSRLYGHGH